MIAHRHRKLAVLTMALMGLTTLPLAPALAESTGLTSFSLAFAASGGWPGAPVSVAAEPHPMQSKAFNNALDNGTPITTDDLLGILVDGDSSSSSTRSSLLEDATLTVVFYDHSTDQTEHLALAECEHLDIDDRSGTIFEARANCDGVHYTYGVGAGGLEIRRETEIAFQLPLDPGTYVLNDIPFVVTPAD